MAVWIDKFVLPIDLEEGIIQNKIYDLDETPVDVKNWWELGNTKTYFEFFNSNRDKFLN